MDNEPERNMDIVEKVDGAIKQATIKILERAKQTHTPLVIWEDGQIKEVPPEKMELRMIATPNQMDRTNEKTIKRRTLKWKH